MNDSAYVVMPIRADGGPPEQDANEVATALEDTLYEKLHRHGNTGMDPASASMQESQLAREGPLKKVIANSDSLYSYISWEDPVRTLTSYFGLLGLLYGIHYLRCTQLLLKAGAIGLGVIVFTSLLSRSTRSDFFARMRPKEYKQVPEPTLNATLSDVHDLVQYLVVQAQKIVYCEDLQATFSAFMTVTALFWLIKFLSPFNLEILGLSTAYLIPLLTTPSGREAAQTAKVRAQELASVTAENAGVAMRGGKAKAVDLSHGAQHAAGNLLSKTQQTASNMTSGAQNLAGNLTSKSKPEPTGITIPSKTQPVAGNLSTGAQAITMDGQPSVGHAVDKGQSAGAERHVYEYHVKNDAE
ncbi:hypothetical protein F4802DRAFT_406362 [Xylaria palmicola]|nr:hypothetical protein F4802DRAFT_406362 [Xylaria palmicola]